MSTVDEPSIRHYVVIWAVLVGALLVSLLLGLLGHATLAVAAIFTIALVKAYLVAAHFMHIKLEPRFVKVILLGALAVVTILYFGLVPDIVWVYGAKEGP
jgi:caa(3)-type oxidase subunit IV